MKSIFFNVFHLSPIIEDIGQYCLSREIWSFDQFCYLAKVIINSILAALEFCGFSDFLNPFVIYKIFNNYILITIIMKEPDNPKISLIF